MPEIARYEFRNADGVKVSVVAHDNEWFEINEGDGGHDYLGFRPDDIDHLIRALQHVAEKFKQANPEGSTPLPGATPSHPCPQKTRSPR